MIADAVIVAAGIGSRVNMVEGLHKALLPHKDQPLISHVISSAPQGTKFHIAVGYQKEQLKSILYVLHPEVDFVFYDIKDYMSPGTGPHTSLLPIAEVLDRPYVCFPADCYYSHEGAFVDDGADVVYVYNSGFPEYDYVVEESPAIKFSRQPSERLFTGVFKVHNTEQFRWGLRRAKGITEAFSGFQVKEMDLWQDFGSVATFLKNAKNTVPIKPNQAIYITEDKVLKYYSDRDTATKVCKKYRMHMGAEQVADNWFSYPYIPGDVVTYHCYDPKVRNGLLSHLECFWDYHTSHFVDISKDVHEMYSDKTTDRVHKFITGPQGHVEDAVKYVNGTEVGGIWQVLEEVLPQVEDEPVCVRLHGDLQPENVIYDGSSFHLIDFRESFGGNMVFGDLYYDLSKMLHGCLVSNRAVQDKKFSISIEGEKAWISIQQLHDLKDLADDVLKWMKHEDLDQVKCLQITALHYLNIAPLYQGGYSAFLYLLGKLMLYKIARGYSDLWEMI